MWFHTNDLNIGPEGLDIGRYSTDQTSPTDGDVDGIGRAGALAKDFHPNCSLAGDDIRVIERMDEAEMLIFAAPACLGIGLVIGLAMENHFAPQLLHGLDLHTRSGDRHHNHRPTVEMGSTESDTLSVVSSTGGDDPTTQLLFGQLGHPVVSPAKFERKNRLKILPLKTDGVGEPATEIAGSVEGGFTGNVVDPRTKNPLEIVVHLPSVTTERLSRLVRRARRLPESEAGPCT